MLSPAATTTTSPARAPACLSASARAGRFRPARASAMPASDDSRSASAPARSVAIVGAGVSGLAAAYRLRKRGVQVTVFEAADRAGGKIRTNSESGFLWDEGANTMTESELEASRLIDDLGLQDKQQYPNSQHKRYIVRDGAPTLLPSDPIALMKSTVISTKSKLKLFLEPLLYEKFSKRNSGKVSDEHFSESVGSFIERHFGKEVVDYLIDPFVAGTSAGDPESLSSSRGRASVFPLGPALELHRLASLQRLPVLLLGPAPNTTAHPLGPRQQVLRLLSSPSAHDGQRGPPC
ncbi:hypothetical protein GUJ93_ZPchr0014g47227 [Zizania palustris]|uniref:Protoporphyrinogen oxidase n=1 Tax=Zizania palustris TaxID=103762 RepID=A0A8J5TKZ3_ZIZPA|nr:hypothetical protein GUJ93_ZPchr0014g47227 [Zizania palustris]